MDDNQKQPSGADGTAQPTEQNTQELTNPGQTITPQSVDTPVAAVNSPAEPAVAQSVEQTAATPPATTPDAGFTPQVINPTEVKPTDSVPADIAPTVSTPTFASSAAPVSASGVAATANSKKKLLFLSVIGATFLLLGGGAGAYFGLVVPNKPENIWKKALQNTSKGYDALVVDSQKRTESKGALVKGTFKFDYPEIVTDGSFESKIYEKNSNTKIDIGGAGTRVSFEVLTNVPTNSKNPDIYLKSQGLDGIGKLAGNDESGIGEYLRTFDNKWYVIDHTLLDQLQKESPNTATTPELTKAEILAIEEAFGRVNRDYLFSTAPDKAVLKIAESIGKEKRDDRSVYHYKVSYNKDNLKKYLTALRDEMKKTKLGEIYKDELNDTKSFDEMLASIDKADDKKTVDVWVDTKTKLIRTVRFTDEKNKDNYFDVGLNYNGGDELPFVFKVHSKEDGMETNVEVVLTLNSKKDDAKLTANFDSLTQGKTIKGKLDATITASNDKVEFTKPANAQSLTDLLGSLYGGGMGATGPDSSPLDVLGAFDERFLTQ